MFRKLCFFIGFLLVLSLGTSPIVSAQAPVPTQQPAHPSRYMPVVPSGQPQPSSLVLGQAGLSYRYLKTLGVTGQPYFADTVHINRPQGLYIDSGNNLYVVEEQGQRLLKYNASGGSVFAIGQAGVCYTGEYSFCGISDVVTDSSGNIWVADGNRIAKYSSTGTFLLQFPAEDPWQFGSDNGHFFGASGIALGSNNRLFVSDRYNHRIQIFSLSSGSPVYSATIGTSGIWGSENTQFYEPYRIAVDGSNRLLVADSLNNRVQVCTLSTKWTCQTFDSDLNWPQGVSVDGSNNVYIADNQNSRIQKCTSAGACSTIVSEAHGYSDVAIDSSGRIYGAAPWEDIILRFSNTGALLGTYKGVQFVPYLTDGYHYLKPRVAIDNANNILILEENGQRLVKLDANGNLLWTFGTPGVDMGWTNDHFAYPHGLAVDKSNNIYVAEYCRVQIISPTGMYLSTLGGPDCGTGNYQFNWASGVAVGDNGNIYVVDNPNQRVMIYNSSKTFIGQIGVTGSCSSASDHFCYPLQANVDSAGNLYATDGSNFRVQKFNSSRQLVMTIGGVYGSQFDQFTNPEDVAVDAQGKIYVTDWNNARVQIFDSAGRYLTTIGGSGGQNSSQFMGTSGIDVDSLGNVYVSDYENARVQVFAPGVAGWRQANINGFGRPEQVIASLEPFNGSLYAGVSVWGDKPHIWKTADGSSWTDLTNPAQGITSLNTVILDMVTFNGYLYVGTGWNTLEHGSLWRTANGTDWTPITTTSFGIAEDSGSIETLVVYQGKIYAAISSSSGTNSAGLSIFRSDSGNAGTWTPVVSAGNGNSHNWLIDAMV